MSLCGELLIKCILDNKILYTTNKPKIINKHLQFEDIKNYKGKGNYIQVESVYLLLRNRGNWGHWFHEHFFPVFQSWISKPYPVICDFSVGVTFYNDFIISSFGEENVILYDEKITYKFENVFNFSSSPEINRYDNYIGSIEKLRHRIFKYYNVLDNERTLNIFYDRGELERKIIIEPNLVFLKENNFEKVILTKKSFKETVELFSKVKNFITPEGAGVVNFIFLDKSCYVLEIHAFMINSWALRMGLSKNINLKIFLTKNIKPSEKSQKQLGLGYEQKQNDSHTVWDKKMENFIKKHIHLKK